MFHVSCLHVSVPYRDRPSTDAGSSNPVSPSIRDTGAYLTPLKQRVNKMICGLADCVVANADAVRRWLIGQGYTSLARDYLFRNADNHVRAPGI